MKVGVVTVNREAEEPVPSRRRIAGTTTIRGAYPEKAREVGAGDVVLKGAIPGVPPSWSTYGDPRARSCLRLRERTRRLRIFFSGPLPPPQARGHDGNAPTIERCFEKA